MNITNQLLKPVQMIWNPQKDITAFELARCLKYWNINWVYRSEIVDEDPHVLKHFDIQDPNK